MLHAVADRLFWDWREIAAAAARYAELFCAKERDSFVLGEFARKQPNMKAAATAAAAPQLPEVHFIDCSLLLLLLLLLLRCWRPQGSALAQQKVANPLRSISGLGHQPSNWDVK